MESQDQCVLQQDQLQRFQTMLDLLLQANPFYRDKCTQAGISSSRDIASLNDYRQLPFTLKTELLEDQAAHPPFGSNLTYPLENYIRVHQTSGTTGTPLRLLDTADSWEWWADCWRVVYNAAAVSANDRIFFPFAFGPFIGFWSAFAGAQKIGALALPGGGMSTLNRAKAILDTQSTVLVCTPTYALHLAEVARENGLDMSQSKIRTTIHAGEPGASLPAVKARIEQAWGARCYDHAGATEVGAWGYETGDFDGMRLNTSEFIFEVLDPNTGVPAEEGELVISNLGRLGMPVIRYRTGDQVRVGSIETAAGLKARVFEGGIIGRTDDMLMVRGVNVYPSAIENIVREFPDIAEFSVDVYRSHELDEMEIKLEIKNQDPDSTARAVALELRNRLALRVKTIAVPYGTLPVFDLKARRFTHHEPLANLS